MDFASKVWDSKFDIYGNWVLNIAQAYDELGPQWECWVETLSGLSAIVDRLIKGTPVVISVCGEIQGAPQAYVEGHLIAICGFDSQTREFLCMDPAFPPGSITIARYQAAELKNVWEKRDYIAYVFNSPSLSITP